MPSGATISVVIPCYNARDYVRAAQQSALEQVPAPFEIICVDDGSSDETVGVLRALEREQPGVVKVIEQPNRGAPAARNKGLAAATGTYVQFLDADDTLFPDKFDRQLRLIDAAGDPPVDLVAGAFVRRSLKTSRETTVRVDTSDPWLCLLTRNVGITSSNLWRRDALQRVGGWNERQPSSQDAELIFRLLASGARVVDDRTPSALVPRLPGSIWNRNMAASLQGWLELRGQILEHLRSNGELTPKRRKGAYVEIFARLRLLFQLDPKAALRFERTLLSSDFDIRTARQGWLYSALYRVLGFRWAEFCRAATERRAL